MTVTQEQFINYIEKIYSLFDGSDTPHDIEECASWIASKHVPEVLQDIFDEWDSLIMDKVRRIWLNAGMAPYVYCCGSPIIGYDYMEKRSYAPWDAIAKTLGCCEE